MLLPEFASPLDHVQMMCARAPLALSEVASLRQQQFILRHVFVADQVERRDAQRRVRETTDADHDVYDRLCPKPRHGRTPDVLDGDDVRADGSEYAPPLLLENLWPAWVVVGDSHRRPLPTGLQRVLFGDCGLHSIDDARRRSALDEWERDDASARPLD